MCQKTVEIVHRAQMERVTQSFRHLPCLLTLYDLQSGTEHVDPMPTVRVPGDEMRIVSNGESES